MRGSATDRLPQRTLKALFLLTLIVGIVLGRWAWLRGHLCSMPARQEIARIKVSRQFWAFLGNRSIPAFEIPEKHWDAVLAALTPCEHDTSPAAWESLCTLDIRTTADRDYRVDLFWLEDDGPGAFKVCVDGRFTYFRGGNSVQLRDAIVAAYDESKILAR
jgi:hypothetical protein